MTLIEAVVATAVVALVVLAASNAVAAVDQLTARVDERDAAEAQVAATLEQLRSLPFAGAGGAEGGDLLSCVFPHADGARDSADATYSDTALGGRPAGTFLTVKQTACGPETIAATFVVGTSGGFAPVAVSRLAGYDAREARVLPSASLLLGVSLDWRSGARSGLVTRAAVVTVRPGASDAPSSPSASPS
jgi:hypothetical protein